MLHGKGRNLIKNAINCLTGRGARLRTLTTYLIAAVHHLKIIVYNVLLIWMLPDGISLN